MNIGKTGKMYNVSALVFDLDRISFSFDVVASTLLTVMSIDL